MAQITNHTSEINNQSICNLQAAWGVTLSTDNDSREFTAYGNTFGDALCNLYMGDDWRELQGRDDIHISGYCEQPMELREFDFALDINQFDGACHYCFAKGRISVEDLMAWICKDTALDDFPGIYDGNYIDLPLTSFTVGSQFHQIAA